MFEANDLGILSRPHGIYNKSRDIASPRVIAFRHHRRTTRHASGTTFASLKQESKRLLNLPASETPGFTEDRALIDGVAFEGDDFPNVPGSIKC